ncbi:metapyrocatechase [Burkholderia glumae]|nr:VOC family protein [Burkholderia glumae]QHP94714.1 metapyrocatechase [Burkholderia glumae]RQZ65824.1 metapyrocatechase [Burkholderia glumae]UVS86070.1 metapyrocatechase [Burkholderia glumae]UVS99739.1 metapyrocatechase [Burkholderia glumae]
MAVHSVDEFVFSVPDLRSARGFYECFGLDVIEEGGALGLYTRGNPHRWGRVVEGPVKRLLWVVYGIHADDAAAFERHLPGRAERIAAPPGAPADGLWLRAPDGLPVQLKVAGKSSPNHPAPRQAPPACTNSGRSPASSKVGQVRPLYLSHILLFTADVSRSLQFYEDVLGLRLSDRSGEVIAFMHTPHGSDHHLIALAKSDGCGLHHSSWCVGSLDEVGMGMRQMERAGYRGGWGVGRHVLGSNYFAYIRDPWNSYAEYSYDIDYVEPGASWPAADHPIEDSLYVWGPDVPEDFVFNYEAQPASPR